MLDDVDRVLLDRVQAALPLSPRPFERIGAELDLDEQEVLERLRRLKSKPSPLIRQISAIFDSAALGYTSTLVAARVDEDQIETAAAVISRHPGVSHNYQRNHIYNLWYTLTVPPDSRLGLERTIELLHDQSGAQQTRMMPAIRLFKIGVKFRMSEQAEVGSGQWAVGSGRSAVGSGQDSGVSGELSSDSPTRRLTNSPSEPDRAMIRVLQKDLPLEPRPFEAWAAQAGVTVDELLGSAQRFLDCGWMRRFSAVLHHRQAGFSANAMGVWIVPEDQIARFGRIAAAFEEVSHCYQRPTYPDWPFNLFTMVHGASRQACESALERISAATGIGGYGSLYSTREFKKVRVRYFTGENEQWEKQHLEHPTAA